jgi:UDP-N-acetylglucosamine enolpyruvyl transferase
MDRIRISGGTRLAGAVRIAGAKNATLPSIAAAILTEEPVILTNVPDVRDVTTMLRVVERLGAEWDAPSHGRRELTLGRITNDEASFELVRTMRASVLVLGPLLARHGHARVSLPGGCAIGARPINLHIEGLRRMGAEVRVEHGYVDATCPRLAGAEFTFDVRTVTGTENLMMAACLAKGTTVLRNAAEEPEIEDLAILLRKMGAKIEGAGGPVVTIEGTARLGGAEHRIIPDRIEAGTYAVAAAITGGELKLEGCEPGHLTAVFEHLRRAGVQVVENPVFERRRADRNGEGAPADRSHAGAGAGAGAGTGAKQKPYRFVESRPYVPPAERAAAGSPPGDARSSDASGAHASSYRAAESRPRTAKMNPTRELSAGSVPRYGPGPPRSVTVSRSGPLRPVDLATSPYPGFPTDMQAQWMALMTQAEGRAVIDETIFEGRFLHAVELQRMGAALTIEGHRVSISGGAPLSGAEVTASDLRASACLVLAGLVADGETLIHRVYHLDRGYERMEEKLRPLGADIERIS